MMIPRMSSAATTPPAMPAYSATFMEAVAGVQLVSLQEKTQTLPTQGERQERALLGRGQGFGGTWPLAQHSLCLLLPQAAQEVSLAAMGNSPERSWTQVTVWWSPDYLQCTTRR